MTQEISRVAMGGDRHGAETGQSHSGSVALGGQLDFLGSISHKHERMGKLPLWSAIGDA